MSLFILDDDIKFPPVHLAEPDGLLAIGGDLSPARLIEAYKNGIFPGTKVIIYYGGVRIQDLFYFQEN